MASLEDSLRFYISQRLKTWSHVQFELSGTTVPVTTPPPPFPFFPRIDLDLENVKCEQSRHAEMKLGAKQAFEAFSSYPHPFGFIASAVSSECYISMI